MIARVCFLHPTMSRLPWQGKLHALPLPCDTYAAACNATVTHSCNPLWLALMAAAGQANANNADAL